MKRNGIFQVSCCLVLLLALALCECGRGEAAVGSRRKGDRVSNIEHAAAGSMALGNGAKNLLFMQEQESTKSRDHHAARKGGKGQKEKKAPSKVLAFVKKHGGRAAAYIKCELGKKLKKSGWCPKKKKRIPGIKPQPPAKPRPVKTVSDESCVVCLYTMEKIDRSIMQVVPGDYQPGMARPYSSDDKVVIAGPDAMPIPGPGFSFLQSKFSVTERKGGKKGGKSKSKKKKGGKGGAPPPPAPPTPAPTPAPTPPPKKTTPKPKPRAGDRMTGCPPGMPFCRKPLFRIGRRSSERTLERMKKFQEESETVQKVDLAIADILKEMPENYHKVINKMDTLSTQIAHEYLHDYTNDDICVDIGFCDPLLLQTTQSSVFT